MAPSYRTSSAHARQQDQDRSYRISDPKSRFQRHMTKRYSFDRIWTAHQQNRAHVPGIHLLSTCRQAYREAAASSSGLSAELPVWHTVGPISRLGKAALRGLTTTFWASLGKMGMSCCRAVRMDWSLAACERTDRNLTACSGRSSRHYSSIGVNFSGPS